MKTIFYWFIAICVVFAILGGILTTCNNAARLNEDAQNTAVEQFKASTLLKKYEWFKDASAALDAKQANINAYDSRFKNLKEAYGSKPRSEWSREDKEQWNLWESEVSGVKASYNDLAAQYNSTMAKFNYRFCNIGDLPKGADTPLPREFKAYLNQ